MKDTKDYINPIATKTVTIVMEVGIYDIQGNEALVGHDYEEPVWIDLEEDEEGLQYIDFYGIHYLDEFTKNN